MRWDPRSRRRPRSRNFREDSSWKEICKSARTTSLARLRKTSPEAF
jgi:hypothetical protein